jgi:hypothetical protein
MRPARRKLRPVAEHDQQRNVPDPVDQEVHDFEGRGIGPVGVLEQHHRRLLAGDGHRRVDECTQCLVLEFLRRHRDRPVALLARDREHRRDEPKVPARPAVLAEDQRFELVEFLLGRVVAREPQGALEIVDDRVERAVGVIRRAMEAQACRVIGLETPAKLAEDAALADARLAGQQHHLAFAILRKVPALHQEA